jgi:hypothetical protein
MKKQAEEERSASGSEQQSNSADQSVTVTEEFTVKRMDKLEIIDEWVVVQIPTDQLVQPKAISKQHQCYVYTDA